MNGDAAKSGRQRPSRWPSRLLPWLWVILGVTATQIVLYGPSLVGKTLLLPLDLLTVGGTYLPDEPPWNGFEVDNRALSDQILNYEPARRFAAGEFRAGRWPLWTPWEFAGTPFAGWAKYSPFQLPYTLFPTPRSLAWIQLLQSLLAGTGAFLFFRRTVGLGDAASGIAACSFPVSGFLALWQGSPLAYPVSWLPWLLWATDAALRRPASAASPRLALITALVVVSGQLDIAALVLLGAFVVAGGRLIALRRDLTSRVRSALGVAAGWVLGLLLSSIFWLPILDYAREGVRLEDRSLGAEERPPVGWSALPQIVLPELYGSSENDSARIVQGSRLESSAAGYAGLLATLLLAPVGVWAAPRAWRMVWLACILLGFAWQLDLPVLVPLLRLPGVNLLSYNRWVFLGTLGLLALAAHALDWLWRGESRDGGATESLRLWLAALGAGLLALATWLGYRSWTLPSSLATEVASAAAAHPSLRGRTGIVEEILATFRASYLVGVLLCLGALLAWPVLRRAIEGRSMPVSRRGLTLLLGLLMLVDLLWHGEGISAQVDPRLDYPALPVIERNLELRDGRILCLVCLPPSLGGVFGLRDVRGYDAVDPSSLVEVLELAGASGYPKPAYARTQFYVPRYRIAGGQIDLPPVLDLLGLRWILGRGRPPAGLVPDAAGDSYWIAENRDAMPRLWMPRRVGVVADDDEMLRRLGHPGFDPAAVAFVLAPDLARDDAAALDPAGGLGRATVTGEVPGRVEVDADVERGGLLVLGDRWSPGWRATVDGEERRVVRVDHLLRGLFLEPGRHRIVFSYRPRGFVVGLRMLGLGLVVLAAWFTWAWRRSSRRRSADGTGGSAEAPSDGRTSART